MRWRRIMPLKWYTTVIDCADLHAQARWWAGVLDWQLIYEADDEAVIVPKQRRTAAFDGRVAQRRVRAGLRARSQGQVQSSTTDVCPAQRRPRRSLEVLT
jgi:Glyoxalase-like domain